MVKLNQIFAFPFFGWT